MDIIPAVDIKDGKCVRLYQGDYGMETVFSDDPVAMALKWQSLGATRIHIVDLDGAAAGKPSNLKEITGIANTVVVPIQVGGGIRQMETIENLLQIGVERVILGTAAIENKDLVRQACHRFGQAVAVSIDAREGKASTHGWQQDTEAGVVDLALSLTKLGLKRLIFTDISRDGTLTEPNFSAILELVDAVRYPVVASGGVSSINHIKVLKKLGVEGAIIGKALYTKDIDLREALVTVN
jgi:phosphoribosylformimino-5-aminoimidazole carboxamide ribotide isomerase